MRRLIAAFDGKTMENLIVDMVEKLETVEFSRAYLAGYSEHEARKIITGAAKR